MQEASTQHPTSDELTKFSLKAFKGIEAGLGQADPVADIAKTLEDKLKSHNLTFAAFRGYIPLKCVRTRVSSGMPPRKSVVFFTPHGFSSTGAVEQEHKTRKGNTARLAAYRFLTLAPTNSLKNELVDFPEVSSRSKAMANHAQGTSVPAIFNFESHDVRVFADEHGEPWFLASDICAVLGYTNTSAAVSKHCRAGGITKRDTPTDSGIQEMTWINEGNLYRLIVKSRKPAAEKFERLVMEEILPAIRKTGRYEAPQATNANDVRFNPEDPASLRALIKQVPRDFLPTVLDAVNARMPGKGGDLLDPSYYREVRTELFAFADSLPPGTQWPGDEAKRQRIADGYLTDILSSRRWMMSFNHQGGMQTTPVPHDAYIVTPAEMAEIIRDPARMDKDDVLAILMSCASRLQERKAPK